MESEDGVTELTVVHGSSDLYGWLTLGNDRGPITMGGFRGWVVVRHQALGVGCNSNKGQLDDAPTTEVVLRSVCEANHYCHITSCSGC